jgi:hypothetical protein
MEQAGANVPGETLKISVGFYGKQPKNMRIPIKLPSSCSALQALRLFKLESLD